jgi:hypothetical protein
MLIVLPSSPTTHKASEYLTSLGVTNSVIAMPVSLNYQNASDVAIYTTDTAHGDLAMVLTKARFVVMRVFKDYRQANN